MEGGIWDFLSGKMRVVTVRSPCSLGCLSGCPSHWGFGWQALDGGEGEFFMWQKALPNSQSVLQVSVFSVSYTNSFFSLLLLFSCHMHPWNSSISNRGERRQRRICYYCSKCGVNRVLILNSLQSNPDSRTAHQGTWAGHWLRRRQHSAVRQGGCLKKAAGGSSASLPNVWALLWPVSLHNGCLPLGRSQLSGHMTDCTDQARKDSFHESWIDGAYGDSKGQTAKDWKASETKIKRECGWYIF